MLFENESSINSPQLPVWCLPAHHIQVFKITDGMGIFNVMKVVLKLRYTIRGAKKSLINDICKKYEVAPCQVYEWKKQLLEQGPHLFEKNDKSKQIAQIAIADAQKKQGKLFEKIGELTVERDFLKKSLQKLPFISDRN